MDDPRDRKTEDRTDARQKAQDAFDLNAELTDPEGRTVPRFLASEHQAARRRKREDQQRDRVLLATVLQTQILRFSSRLSELERAAILALREADKRVQDADRTLEDVRKRATRDTNGNLVYRSEDGDSAFFEDGRKMLQEDIDAVPWNPSAPSWETHRLMIDEAAAAHIERDAVGQYLDRLDSIKRRVQDGTPLAEDELAELQRSAETVPGAVAEQLAARDQKAESRPDVAALAADVFSLPKR